MSALLVNRNIPPFNKLQWLLRLCQKTSWVIDKWKQISKMIDFLIPTLKCLFISTCILFRSSMQIFIVEDSSWSWMYPLGRLTYEQLINVLSFFNCLENTAHSIVFVSRLWLNDNNRFWFDDLINLVEQKLTQTCCITHCIYYQFFGKVMFFIVFE